ncbi:uncharacterized protein LOC123327128 [Drosophila simulans]|uniref:uncharacterized protein LOC123327128 n=1 Tax=Drosophila simulans TaxID=7240 RepID=UPI001D0FCED8|nr:uncharacterized protein LOC123327128 [Drosophila simulans]
MRGQVTKEYTVEASGSKWPAGIEGRALQGKSDSGSGGEIPGVSVRVSGVSGQQRWSQAERCLARGRYTLPHNILNPNQPAEGLPQETTRSWRAPTGTVESVVGKGGPRPSVASPVDDTLCPITSLSWPGPHVVRCQGVHRTTKARRCRRNAARAARSPEESAIKQ